MRRWAAATVVLIFAAGGVATAFNLGQPPGVSRERIEPGSSTPEVAAPRRPPRARVTSGAADGSLHQEGLLVRYDWQVAGSPKSYVREDIEWPDPMLVGDAARIQLGTAAAPASLELQVYTRIDETGAGAGDTIFVECSSQESGSCHPVAQGDSVSEYELSVSGLGLHGDMYLIASGLWRNPQSQAEEGTAGSSIANWLFHLRRE